MKKKLLAIVMAMIMVLSTASVAVFAEDGSSATYPNISADVYPDNMYCIHYEDAKVSIKITKEGMDPITIDLKYDDEWESYSFEGKAEGIDAIIDDITNNKDLMKAYSNWMADFDTEEEFDILDKAGYKVEVIAEDNDANHEFEAYEIESSIVTKDIIDATTNAITNMIMVAIVNSSDAETLAELAAFFGGVNLIVEEGAAYIVYADNTEKEAVEFNDLIKLMKNEEVAKEMELDEEDLAGIKEYEDMMAAMEAGTYKGELTIDASLKCGCPDINEYTLYHEYYDANGKYVGQVSSDIEAAVGTYVKVDDIKLVEKYDGKTYKFVGLYPVDEKTGEGDWDNPIKTGFEIPGIDDDYIEVIAKYVLTSSSAGTDAVPADSDKGGKSPDTGDDFNVLPFAAVMLLAAAGMAAAVVRRRA